MPSAIHDAARRYQRLEREPVAPNYYADRARLARNSCARPVESGETRSVPLARRGPSSPEEGQDRLPDTTLGHAPSDGPVTLLPAIRTTPNAHRAVGTKPL
jgi:hypothetical protein